MIRTWSKFIYGTSVDTTNCNGDFSEGAGDLLATLPAGGYTLGELITQVQTTLNELTGLTYTVTISRTTGLVTISAGSNFEILLSSGANIGSSFWPILGFTSGADLTGASTYTGNVQAGSIYYPQFLLQSYVGPDNYQQSSDAMINKSANGRTELIRFAVEKYIEFELKFITNLAMDGVVIKNNPTGLTNAISFLEDITAKSRFEFVPDVGTPATFHKVICESAQGGKDGSGFKLRELFMQDLPDIYESGLLTLRVVV